MKALFFTLVASVAAFGIQTSASAAPILGGQLFALGGEVEVRVLPSSSGFSNEISLYEPNGMGGFQVAQFIGIDNNTTAFMSLGVFAPGTELVFGIETDKGHTFLNGPAGRNPDNLEHAFVDDMFGGDPTIARIRFEDIFGGGDNDFNDAVIEIRQTPDPAAGPLVPEPAGIAIWILLLIGVCAVYFFRRQRIVCHS